jgi:hypothetical protein
MLQSNNLNNLHLQMPTITNKLLFEIKCRIIKLKGQLYKAKFNKISQNLQFVIENSNYRSLPGSEYNIRLVTWVVSGSFARRRAYRLKSSPVTGVWTLLLLALISSNEKHKGRKIIREMLMAWYNTFSANHHASRMP